MKHWRCGPLRWELSLRYSSLSLIEPLVDHDADLYSSAVAMYSLV